MSIESVLAMLEARSAAPDAPDPKPATASDVERLAAIERFYGGLTRDEAARFALIEAVHSTIH